MGVQHPLHSLDDIASSQPIALSELWNRASLRGKVTKPLKPLQIADRQFHDAKEISTDTGSIVVAQCKPRSHLVPMHRPCTETGHHSGPQTEILQRSRIRSEAYYPTYAHEAKEYLWQEKADGHVQQNPLSYCGGYDPSYPQCLRHDYRSISDGLFYKHQNILQSEHAIWPAEPCAATNNTRVASYEQCRVADHKYIQESYIELPHDGIRTRDDLSGYLSLEGPGYHYSQRDMRGAALPIENASTRAEALGDAEAQAPNSIRVSLPSHDRKPSSAESDSSKASSKRSIKEEATAFLQSVVENSHLDAKGTRSLAVTVQSEESAVARLQQGSQETEYVKSEPVSMCDRNASLEDTRLINEQINLGDKANSKAVPPPPGLPIPLEQQKDADSLFFDTLAPNRARLEEANSWFHTDNRGASELRQLVSSIAYDNVEREALLHGNSRPTSETTTAWQTTLLLGNVIANLQLHASSDLTQQADYFSDYAVVDSACCEPSHGGRRSYFFQDPAVTHWKLPADRATPGTAKESEYELAGPQIYSQPSGTW
ncbi:hypothetical protein KXX29_005795 [Aspergillus fumigatus]|nr:hypothetical protein KXX29_005795 [Aspergillus fumigatus]